MKIIKRIVQEDFKVVDYSPEDKTVCVDCGLFREQPEHIEPGAINDMGWWCQQCINKGRRRSHAQVCWQMFAQDYPQFALELKRLRKQASR